MQNSVRIRSKRLVIVGAFPPKDARVFGGVITSCRLLQHSSLPDRADLTLVDSTQISNPPPNLLIRALLAIVRILEYVSAIARSRPDAILLFCSADASFVEKGFLAWVARIFGIPAILFPRGGSLMSKGTTAVGRALLRQVSGGAVMVLCQGEAWQRFAIDVLRLPEERSPVVRNWSATPKLLEIGQSRVYRTDGSVGLLFVGRVEKNKGIGELLEAFALVAVDHDVVLNIVGDGNAMPFVRKFAVESGLQSKIRISGWMDTHDILLAYQEADVFVLPSWAEGLPNAMIEAMAAGLAVVVSKVGNIPDVISNRQEALLVAPMDVDSVRSALVEIVGDCALRTSLAKSGHALAKREFGIDVAVDRILQAVERACS